MSECVCVCVCVCACVRVCVRACVCLCMTYRETKRERGFVTVTCDNTVRHFVPSKAVHRLAAMQCERKRVSNTSSKNWISFGPTQSKMNNNTTQKCIPCCIPLMLGNAFHCWEQLLITSNIENPYSGCLLEDQYGGWTLAVPHAVYLKSWLWPRKKTYNVQFVEEASAFWVALINVCTHNTSHFMNLQPTGTLFSTTPICHQCLFKSRGVHLHFSVSHRNKVNVCVC